MDEMITVKARPWPSLSGIVLALSSAFVAVQGDVQSNPYIPFRTSAFDQDKHVHHAIHLETPDRPAARVQEVDLTQSDQCPLHFSLGISKKWHEIPDDGAAAVRQPPVVRAVFPATGPGKQVLYLTQYEHLDLLSPSSSSGSSTTEALVQAPEFPMLWESSAFHASPLVHDVNGDGIMDAIAADYDGGISVMGLAQEPGKSRYFLHTQVPRLHLRRDWVESRIGIEVNKTRSGGEEETADGGNNNKDYFHSYFEYYVSNQDKNEVLRGVTANVLQQDETAAKTLAERRSRTVSHESDVKTEIHPAEEQQQQEEAEPAKTEDEEQQPKEQAGEPQQQQEQQEEAQQREEVASEEQKQLEEQRRKEQEEEQRRKRAEERQRQRAELLAQEKQKQEEEQRREKEETERQRQQQQEQQPQNPDEQQQQNNPDQQQQQQQQQQQNPDQQQQQQQEQQNPDQQQQQQSPEEQARREQEERQRQEEEQRRQEEERQRQEEERKRQEEERKRQEEQQQQQNPEDQQRLDEEERRRQEEEQRRQQQQQQAPEEQQRREEEERRRQEEEEQRRRQEEEQRRQQEQQQQTPEDQQRREQEERQRQEEEQRRQQEPQQQESPEEQQRREEEERQRQKEQRRQAEEQRWREEEEQRRRAEEQKKQEQEAQNNQQQQQNPDDEQRRRDEEEQRLRQEQQRAEEAVQHRRLEEEPPDDIMDDGLLDVDRKTGDDMFNDDEKWPADDDYRMARGFDGDGASSVSEGGGGAEDKKTREFHDDFMNTDDPHRPDPYLDDYDYGREHHIDDDYRRYADFDDYYGKYDHDDFYDDIHYIRVPPHILSTPVLAELPRLYGDTTEKDDVMFVAASYFFDEDEYEGKFSHKRFNLADHGDESEVKRGMYVASAILAYTFEGNGRWSAQTHLDLSTDHTSPENVTVVGAIPIRADLTEMGAFALASPTVADLNGDGTPDVLIGTSMGFLYLMEGRNLYKRENWPIQMPHAIETRPVVEDVLGDTNLEIFVTDTGGNVVCFSHEARVLWNRNILKALPFDAQLSGSSPMTLGDVNGDGLLDLVITVKVAEHWVVFALEAATGKDLKNFPLKLESGRKSQEDGNQGRRRIPQPLLVDLHGDQSHVLDYIRRSTRSFKRGPRSGIITREMQQGGTLEGLHIVQPVEKQLFIVEAASGCTQKVMIGDEVTSMVQVEDIHGTNKLDLLVATESGKILTLESSATYHPLNTWAGGDVRGRNSHAHGYSASQGIFVHDVSRQFGDIMGVYVPITFEIFDNRPNIESEPDKRVYKIEVRDGSSPKRVIHRVEYNETGVFTERVYIRYGPGYYNLCLVMGTSHGLFYEDCFSTGYNVHFMSGFGVMLWLPLVLASTAIFLCGVKKANWDDDEDDEEDREGRSLGILGRDLPT